KLRIALAATRWLAFALVLLMLGELELRVERYGLPLLVLAIDDSQSMSISDPYQDTTLREQLELLVKGSGSAEPTRLNIAKALLVGRDGELLKRLTRGYRLVLCAVSSGVRHLGQFDARHLQEAVERVRSVEPAGSETRLGTGLSRLLDELGGTPPAAIVLLTDGRTTSGTSVVEAARDALARNVPIHAVGIGSPLPARDLELHDLLVEDVVFVDDMVMFEAKLSARGAIAKPALVQLKRAGQEQPVMSKLVELPRDGKPAVVRLFDRPAQTGEIKYVLEVEPVEHELQTENNRLERVVSVREQKLRVLMVESYPRFEYRFLKHLLERERTVELNVLLLEADPGYPEQDRVAIAHFPTSRDELWKY
ncbi:MAG TPA: VWA domain-containing protein, partial [Planctomycetaceae bacterium]|nr:VWA domain-containing protein [Planctomycetaceae bacterium]